MVVSCFFFLIMFTPKIGEMIQFDEHIFQMGWFNHQLVNHFKCFFSKLDVPPDVDTFIYVKQNLSK